MIKIVNVYIVYELYKWPKNTINNFKFKNCLFGAASIIKNSDNEKYLYSGQWITFNSIDWWSADNYSARNVIIFGSDNNSSPHAGNCKNLKTF